MKRVKQTYFYSAENKTNIINMLEETRGFDFKIIFAIASY